MLKHTFRNKKLKKKEKDHEVSPLPDSDGIAQANKKQKTLQSKDKVTQNSALKKILDHLQKDLNE